MNSAYAPDMPVGLDDEDFHFEADGHAYYDAGVRTVSLTQAMGIVGLVDYSRVPPDILAHAAWRGKMVHDATAEIDRGVDIAEVYEIPAQCSPYVEAYQLFVRETGFVADRNQIERPRIVTIANMRVGLTPDVVGELFGMPAVVERKTCASRHPAWSIQTAGQEMGLTRPHRHRRYQRYAVQLLRTGKYKLDPHEDDNDFEICCDVLRLAAWKLKHRLAKLD